MDMKSERRAPTTARAANTETGPMSDIAMIAIGCASFAILILYTYSCDRM
jgi:hypothetical protein